MACQISKLGYDFIVQFTLTERSIMLIDKATQFPGTTDFPISRLCRSTDDTTTVLS